MSLKNCYNFDDFRKLAKKKLPAPIFHYIDGGADDEVTMNRNTDSFNDCDLIPNILKSGFHVLFVLTLPLVLQNLFAIDSKSKLNSQYKVSSSITY